MVLKTTTCREAVAAKTHQTQMTGRYTLHIEQWSIPWQFKCDGGYCPSIKHSSQTFEYSTGNATPLQLPHVFINILFDFSVFDSYAYCGSCSVLKIS